MSRSPSKILAARWQEAEERRKEDPFWEHPVPHNGLPPIHPGEIIREDFLKPWHMTVSRLAEGLGMRQTAVSQLLQGKRAVTPLIALKLSRFLGCSPEFWLKLQMDCDLKVTVVEQAAELAAIQKYQHQGELHLDDDEFDPDAPEISLSDGALESEREPAPAG